MTTTNLATVNLESRRIDKSELLLYDHTKFNETIEILIKMLDRFNRFDRIFDA